MKLGAEIENMRVKCYVKVNQNSPTVRIQKSVISLFSKKQSLYISHLPYAVWQNVSSFQPRTPQSPVALRCICFACVVDQKGRLLKPAIMGWVAQDIWGSTVERGFEGKMRAKSHCRWWGQLIFTEGHGLEQLSLVLCDKDEQLQWSNFKGCRFSLFIHSPDSCQSDEKLNPQHVT